MSRCFIVPPSLLSHRFDSCRASVRLIEAPSKPGSSISTEETTVKLKEGRVDGRRSDPDPGVFATYPTPLRSGSQIQPGKLGRNLIKGDSSGPEGMPGPNRFTAVCGRGLCVGLFVPRLCGRRADIGGRTAAVAAAVVGDELFGAGLAAHPPGFLTLEVRPSQRRNEEGQKWREREPRVTELLNQRRNSFGPSVALSLTYRHRSRLQILFSFPFPGHFGPGVH